MTVASMASNYRCQAGDHRFRGKADRDRFAVDELEEAVRRADTLRHEPAEQRSDDERDAAE